MSGTERVGEARACLGEIIRYMKGRIETLPPADSSLEERKAVLGMVVSVHDLLWQAMQTHPILDIKDFMEAPQNPPTNR